MIWILGGTHEVPLLINKLKDYSDIIVTVVTDEAREFLPKDLKVRVGALTEKEKCDFVRKNNIDLIIDMTHPFAKHIKKSIKDFAQKLGIKFVRYNRPILEFKDSDILYVKSYDEAIRKIKSLSGTFFFTTGVNEADRFFLVKGDNRFVFRILPSVSSVKKITDIGVSLKDICAMLGPFSTDLNEALLKTYNADYLVTKNSGDGSGIKEKLEAAKKLGVKVIMIETETVEGIDSLDKLKKILEDRDGTFRRNDW